ncbi:MAG: Cna B-type domain-containing protein [Ruminococcus sp.]
MSANAQYLFKVEEAYSDIKGYKCTTTETITGGIVQQDGKSTLIVGGNAANFKFTNTYVNNQKNISFTKIWDDFNNYYGSRPENLNITLQGKVKNQVAKSYVVTLSNESAVLTKENKEGVTVESASSGNTNAWKCIWKGVPIYDDDNNLIDWSVKEGEVNSSYAYQESEVRVGDGSNYQEENTSVIADSKSETVTEERCKYSNGRRQQ